MTYYEVLFCGEYMCIVQLTHWPNECVNLRQVSQRVQIRSAVAAVRQMEFVGRPRFLGLHGGA